MQKNEVEKKNQEKKSERIARRGESRVGGGKSGHDMLFTLKFTGLKKNVSKIKWQRKINRLKSKKKL